MRRRKAPAALHILGKLEKYSRQGRKNITGVLKLLAKCPKSVNTLIKKKLLFIF